MKRFFVFIFLFCAVFIYSQDDNSTKETNTTPSLVSEDPAATPPAPMGFIKDLRFKGLVRTSKKWLMSLFGAFIGCPVPYFQEAQLKGGLMAMGLFNDVAVDLIKETDKPDSDAIIIVTVKEKWSLFGAVYGWGDDAGFVGGFAFTDMNAMGRHDIYMITGAFGADVQQGNFMYLRPPMGVKKPGFIVSADVSNNTPNYRTFDDDEVSKKEMLKTGCSLSVMGFCPAFMYTIGWGYSYTGWFHDDILNLHINTLSVMLSKGWDKNNEWFPISRGVGVGGEFNIDYARWCKPMGKLSANAVMTFPVYKYHRMLFRFTANGAITFDRPITMQLNRDSVKSFIAQSGWASDMFLSGRVSWETALFRAKFLNMSFFTSFEGIVGRDIRIDQGDGQRLDVRGDGTPKWAIGPGAGVKFYFHAIPIPIMMMGAFYNINQNTWQFGFSVGV